MNQCVLVIDLGTTNIKASLFSLMGNTLAVRINPTPVKYENGIMEILPNKLWETVKAVCASCMKDIPKIKILAVSISSMAASFIPMDRHREILFNAIGWNDERSTPYMNRYMKLFLAGQRIKNCGQYPLPMYAPFKIQWLKDEHSDIAGKIDKWLNVSEFVYYKMLGTGEIYTDYSIASRTMLFDVVRQEWNLAAVSYFDMDVDWFASPLPAGTEIGTVGKEMIDLGFDRDTVIVLGGHDHMCAFAGANVTSPDIVLNSTGTSEAVESILADSSVSVPEEAVGRWLNLECTVMPQKAAVVNYVSASGQVYKSTCASLKEYDPHIAMEPMSDLIFIPPERAMLPSVQGKLIGIKSVFNSQKLIRAMRDGMYFECRRGIERITGKKSLQDLIVRCVGGHTKDLDELQIKSNVLGCSIDVCNSGDISSRGAFILGGVGCKAFDSVEKAAASLYGRMEVKRICPDKDIMKKYEKIYFENYLTNFEAGETSL